LNNIIINKYEVLINEKNGTCGLVVNSDFNLSKFKNEKLFYNVNFDNKTITVESLKSKFIFVNADKELLYYAIKSLNLIILCGKLKPKPHILYILEADLN
jgi:hypothetical protein